MVVCEFSCSVACGILVPQPGIEPVSLVLQGRFLTTGPPGKFQIRGFKTGNTQYCSSRCKRMLLGSPVEQCGALLEVGALHEPWLSLPPCLHTLGPGHHPHPCPFPLPLYADWPPGPSRLPGDLWCPCGLEVSWGYISPSFTDQQVSGATMGAVSPQSPAKAP